MPQSSAKLSAYALAVAGLLALSAPPKPAVAGEVQAAPGADRAGDLVHKTNTKMGPITEGYEKLPRLDTNTCGAKDIAEASSRINGQCDLDCVVAALPEDPGDVGSRNVDTVIQIARECDAGDQKRLFGVGTMEQKWVDTVLATEDGTKLLRDYLGLASLEMGLSRNNPDSPRLPELRREAEALKGELMAIEVPNEASMSDRMRKAIPNQKRSVLSSLTAEVAMLNNADIRKLAGR
jgi:hypothetical protein